MARLKERYENEITKKLAEKFGYTNPMAIPKLEKVVINMGVGRAVGDKNILPEVSGHLAIIAGQKPMITKARRSVSGFKVREGYDVGCMVTIRGRRMYEFIDRFVTIALPRIRDFRGLSPKAFDGHGNFSVGVTEQVIFPEVNPDKVHYTQGMHITFVSTTDRDEEARELLREFGIPFQRNN